ncbi:acetyl-CoA carboxylase carboxyltransferase subunit alpha [Granulicella sp. WH15]|uniref:acetyl-CoA carboxylase carboxyltransferase subunit alpha n=1 Tax=Granulicella sp. WH15 TaxID=2602070 RepID=UPI0013672AF1|nr:acetyl-CoA carboxylase carboxyltransferase subunit alpha [Granulicella sp. WH15]QHN03546.1 acetyl-CoA carboxylase carboxyltransferase subunit alpha [Granulicella sp. WH15]
MAEQELSKKQSAVPEAWVRTELARDPQRPYPMDFIEALFTDFSEIHGDRAYGDDAAMSCGMARFHGEAVLVIGNLKGRTLKERVARRFGSPEPEGYRKALRAMKIAEKFGRPIFTFLDLAGAFPGISSEERGQGEAIARNLLEMSRLRVPTIATITGEGGSGGALALAVADRVLMLENAIYSVISPEAGASIMWKDAGKKVQAAAALKYTSDMAKKLGCVDEVVDEPVGGSQADPAAAIAALDQRLQFHLADLRGASLEAMLAARYQKFRTMAQFYTVA